MRKEIDWSTVTIQNNFLFQDTFRNEALCNTFLNCVLHIPVKHIRYLETEKSVKATLPGKGTRLDVYVEDEKGNAADIEMQVVGKSSILYNDLDIEAELAAFLRYVQENVATNAFTKAVDKEATRIRNRDDWRLKIMTLDMEIDDMKRRIGKREHEKGKQEGLNEGKQESKREIAKKMLADGMDIDKIVRFTELSKEEVAALA